MIIKRDVLFTPAGSTRCLHIYLPDSYAEGNDLYPVMYFFDGHNLFDNADATYGKSWGLKEYCPYTFRGKFWGGTLKGTGKETLQWMVSELKPMIDREYRTWSHREATGIGGSSMGGLMSLYAAICFNEWFSKAACVSSSISPCMAPLRRDIKKTAFNPDTRIYLSFGTEEAFRKDPHDPMKSLTAQHNLTVQADLREHGISSDLYCQIGGHHSEASWEEQVPRFMNYLWC